MQIHETPPETASTVVSTPLPALPRDINKEDPAWERERQQAFDSAFAWRGKPLLPFSSSRESLFTQHRLSMGAPDLQRCLDDLDGFFADAARILWLCSHTPDDWAILRCSPTELQRVIDEWTDDHIQGTERTAATSLAFKIYVTAHTNEHQPAPIAKGSSDDSGN